MSSSVAEQSITWMCTVSISDNRGNQLWSGPEVPHLAVTNRTACNQ